MATFPTVRLRSMPGEMTDTLPRRLYIAGGGDWDK